LGGVNRESREAIRQVAERLLDHPLWAKLSREFPEEAVEEVRRAVAELGEPVGSFVLSCDGASHGNPGPAGAGGIIRDGRGGVVERYSLALGEATNNVAEYRALLAGLDRLLSLGATKAVIRLDSELLVRQVTGRYRVKSPHLVPLYQSAMEKLDRIAEAEVIHVPREENAEADRLAELGIRGGDVGGAGG